MIKKSEHKFSEYNGTNSKWLVYHRKYDDVIDQILTNRDIELKNKDSFLNPDFDNDLLDPFSISQMSKAVEIIIDCVKDKKRIGIFADYDADGIPGAAFMSKVLDILSIDNFTYIPKRSEGYGLNKKGIDELRSKGVDILITVDLGITNKKEVEYAKKLGLKVIVTDHHEIQESKFPDKADAIVHTHISKKYDNKDLAGGAVVFKLAQAISLEYGKPSYRQLKWLLDLPAISTICDMVPIKGENRVISKFGLVVLRKSKNVGLNKLYKHAEIDKSNISTYTVGFLIGPRINASGRISDPKIAYDLLTTKDNKLAEKISIDLDKTNKDRQNYLDDYVKKAKEEIARLGLSDDFVIVVSLSSCPNGIVGLVSSRISEYYSRPCIVFSKTDGILRGSARSIEKFNIVKALDKIEKILLSYGGHEAAAGLSIKMTNLNVFRKRINVLASRYLQKSDLVKVNKVDVLVNKENLNLQFTRKMEKLSPHGFGNPRPIFMLKDMIVKQIRWIGSKFNHMKLSLVYKDRNDDVDAISFNARESFGNIRNKDIIDIIFTIEENVWRGRSSVQLKIIDLIKK